MSKGFQRDLKQKFLVKLNPHAMAVPSIVAKHGDFVPNYCARTGSRTPIRGQISTCVVGFHESDSITLALTLLPDILSCHRFLGHEIVESGLIW